MNEPTIRIHELKTADEIEPVLDLQKKIWMADDKDCIPSHFIKVLTSIGGFMLGAFDNQSLVGAALIIPAFDINSLKPYHYLQFIGVLSDCRCKNVGYHLLKRQMEISKKLKIEKIEWTFDPLESSNANLYIKKLSALIEKSYLPNYYGTQLGRLNQDIESDRFTATLYLHEKEKENFDFDNYLVINKIENNKLISYNLLDSSNIAVEIPYDFQDLKLHNLELAQDWRMKTREIFQYYLQSGKKIKGFVCKQSRNYYLIN